MLFSSISPDYEINLKDELFGCFKYIGIPFDILDRMPIRDRKFYIAKHNGIVELNERKASSDNRIDGAMIDKFTDMTQQTIENSKKR